VPVIIDEVEIQMVAQYAQSASSVQTLQMLTQLFVERAHIQVQQDKVLAVVVLLEATV
jgi:hypothetical protein